MILETKRLYLREMTEEDKASLSKILQDKDVMYAYEHAFSDNETKEWLENQIRRYHKDGFGLWAVILKETNTMIGQCGLTLQAIPNDSILEIGYLFQRAYWHQGYAIEAASACKKYAFETLHANQVCSIIRDNNMASIQVATRNGMKPTQRFVKHYYEMDMPHTLYQIDKAAYESEKKTSD